MPSLDSIPTEILIIILGFLGREYFRLAGKVDIGRLLVCKAWYRVAQSVALEDLTVNTSYKRNHDDSTGYQYTLQRFLVAPRCAQDLVKANTRKLSINGKGLSMESLGSPEHYSYVLCYNLQCLASHLSEMTKLREFEIRIPINMVIEEQLGICWRRSITIILSSLPKNIINLTIELPAPKKFQQSEPEHSHICPSLLSRDFLPRLRHLRISLPRICSRLLVSPDQNTQLETLIINLTTVSRTRGTICQSRPCHPVPESSFPNFVQHMQDAATAATIHLPSIKTLKVISVPKPETGQTVRWCSYDAIAKKTLYFKLWSTSQDDLERL